MTTKGFALFETAIGACGIAWSPRGIAGVQLPEASADKTRVRLQRRFPAANEAPPTPEAQRAIDGIVALLHGEAVDFSAVRLDLQEMPAFNRRVYDIARAIPPGKTLSYGEIAARLGEPREVARDVGQALGQNPIPIIVPCHRVLAANGKPGGFSASGGVTTKLRLLTIEKAKLSDSPALFDELPLAAKPRRR
ncbi:MAG TPA: methylated-DNA--[protein]-cysteine S-methyltransferase [Xanthobacteraceae bacterium]|nr:methylated-DNA--[protein]-cysteine S-methyltransferase [Xanthobacteraceae bacterium]